MDSKICPTEIEDLSNKLQNVVKLDEEDVYVKARKDTFLRYYNQLSNNLATEQILEFIAVVVSGDVIEYEKLYNSGVLDVLYNTNKSITQSLRAQAGMNLENIIIKKLTQNKIDYAKQVYVKDGKVKVKTKFDKGGHKLDFVVPSPTLGDDIKNYTHISSKTTLRERVHQDQHIDCKKNIVVTYDTKTEQATANGFTCITLTRNKEIGELDKLIELLR